MRLQPLPEVEFEHRAVSDVLRLQHLREHRHARTPVSGELTPMMASDEPVELPCQWRENLVDVLDVLLCRAVDAFRLGVVSRAELRRGPLPSGGALEIRIVSHPDDSGMDLLGPADIALQPIHVRLGILDVTERKESQFLVLREHPTLRQLAHIDLHSSKFHRLSPSLA